MRQPDSSAAGTRPRLAVAVTFPVEPRLGGGQVRAFNLYRGLARTFDVEMVTLGATGSPERRSQIAPGLWEHRVPKSVAHAEREMALEREVGTAVTDIAMARLYHDTPAYLDALRAATDGAHAAVACHPYTFPAIREVSDVPLWYEAQDVEATLKQQALGAGPGSAATLAYAEQVERDCCRQSDLIWACSAEDGRELIERYALDADKVLVVPNGAALDEVSFVSPSVRSAHKRRLQMSDRFMAIFIASWHEPNVEGARGLLAIAGDLPEVDFMLLGSVGSALSSRGVADNVTLTGTVSLGFKQTILSVADVALNPVTTGSGTNLKMLDYFAAGIPVISTAFGARGFGVRAGEHFLGAEVPNFHAELSAYRQSDPTRVEGLVKAARAHVESRLSWDVITRELLAEIAQRSGVSQLA